MFDRRTARGRQTDVSITCSVDLLFECYCQAIGWFGTSDWLASVIR
jgi:hypothetical protein